MFRLQCGFKDYWGRRVKWLEAQKATKNSVISRMEQNGIVVGHYGIALYWGLSLRETHILLQRNRIHAQASGRKEVFFRPDLWVMYEEYLNYLRRMYPKHFRLERSLVSCDDVAVFYEISRTNAARVLKKAALPSYRQEHSSRLVFYDYEDVITLEETHQVFSRVTFYSGHSKKGNMATGAYIFRDADCPRYLACTDFSGSSSDYMNCAICAQHLKRQKHPKRKPSDALAVFTPQDKAGIKKLQQVISRKLGGNLALLPNVF